MPEGWPDRANWHQNDEAQIGWEYTNGVFAPPPPPPVPDPVEVPLQPALYAMGRVTVADGDISSVSVSAKIAGAFMFDVGQFWVFLAEEQADTNYLALAYDGGSVRAFVQDDEKFVDYFVIRTTDFANVPTNPPSLNFEVKRVS
jgi:hypothetical protein